ncbi:MAG: imidazole glycerol phosphate synthase subunit HisH [Acidobacteria bacterium]|nr:imidazole glycerol phosphate synthase subunit HisH [Acidobacteriota bacterium]
MITIIDYGMGNVGSILNMLKRIGVAARVSANADEIRAAERLILPGVGAFDTGMANLASMGLRDVLDEKVQVQQTPVLGVCLGMQLLTGRSEEGRLRGLGWIKGETVRFRFDPKTSHLKIPHMGWNTVKPVPRAPLFASFSEPPRFYFVHSYHVVCAEPADLAATVCHGDEVTAAITRGHIMGVQFHPEKSHTFGMKLLKTFAELPFAQHPRSPAC